MVLDSVVPRRVSELLKGLVAVEPVIALHGPRSVGKSTVLRGFAADIGGTVLDLDDVEVREAVVGNLASVVSGPAPVCVDEYQRVPEILDALKARLNREGSRPGTAVITEPFRAGPSCQHRLHPSGRPARHSAVPHGAAALADHLAAVPRGDRRR